jgi:Flp pilus assembly protein TadB
MFLSLVFVPFAFAHGLSSTEGDILFLIVVFGPFIVLYLLGLFLAKIFALFSKKKPQEGIYIRATYIFMICSLVCGVLSFIYEAFIIVFILTVPFLIISLIILLLVKKTYRQRDNAFEDLLEKSRKNEE